MNFYALNYGSSVYGLAPVPTEEGGAGRLSCAPGAVLADGCSYRAVSHAQNLAGETCSVIPTKQWHAR